MGFVWHEKAQVLAVYANFRRQVDRKVPQHRQGPRAQIKAQDTVTRNAHRGQFDR